MESFTLSKVSNGGLSGKDRKPGSTPVRRRRGPRPFDHLKVMQLYPGPQNGVKMLRNSSLSSSRIRPVTSPVACNAQTGDRAALPDIKPISTSLKRLPTTSGLQTSQYAPWNNRGRFFDSRSMVDCPMMSEYRRSISDAIPKSTSDLPTTCDVEYEIGGRVKYPTALNLVGGLYEKRNLKY
eukprot:gnl/MRDRNA2_/MRDRNA2_104396_c0_seq1.p1 gnl/MRDRNA2_/MRDRNA2_104396_c0~~gnl/MRDRNA2_/MRDRNA2_104396_c0_seq1.p1  ORF type:complete len:181 (+),score=19.19 gnl/MRDRNA2_/MRDRNA2_104396_c0_seq1:71-613(+)